MRAGWFLLVALHVLPVSAFADDGKLERVREEVRSGPPEATVDTEPRKHDRADACDPPEDLGAALWAYYLVGVRESFTTPTFFARYPYADGLLGYLQPDRQLASLDGAPLGQTRPWAMRVSVEEGNDFDGLNRVGGQIIVDTSTHFGFQTSWNVYQERLAGRGTDELFLGDANIILRLLSMEVFQDRVGVGMRYLTEPGHADVGVNVLYAQDWFPFQPVVFSHTLEFGTLGDAGVFHYRATLGCTWSHVEVFAGYDVLRIGNVWLDGPLVGLRVWF